MTYVNIEANSVDPDETAPTGAVSSGSTFFVSPAKHGRHIGNMSMSASPHFWFPINNF